jgi:hypothetical protein
MPCPLSYVLTVIWKPYQDCKIKRIITEADDAERMELAKQWLRSKVQETDIVLNMVYMRAYFCSYLANTPQSFFMTGIVAASLSWFDRAVMSWSTLACLYCSIFAGLTSVTTAAQQAIAFKHMLDAHGYDHRLRESLGTSILDRSQNIKWEPNYWYIYLLQIPAMMLKMSYILFLLGFELEVWGAAVREGLNFSARETKVL